MPMMFPQFKAIRMAELASEQWGDLRVPDLLELLASTRPSSVLEIGCYRGVSTEVFLLHCAAVTAVDPWPEGLVRRQFLVRCGHYPHLTRVEGPSPSALPDGTWDMCYIDGDHSYEAVRADIAACRRRAGTWIAGHDWYLPDVAQAVFEALGPPVHIFSDGSWVHHAD